MSVAMPRHSRSKANPYVILLLQVDSPSVFANTKALFLGQLPHFPIMLLVSDRSGGC